MTSANAKYIHLSSGILVPSLQMLTAFLRTMEVVDGTFQDENIPTEIATCADR